MIINRNRYGSWSKLLLLGWPWNHESTYSEEQPKRNQNYCYYKNKYFHIYQKSELNYSQTEVEIEKWPARLDEAHLKLTKCVQSGRSFIQSLYIGDFEVLFSAGLFDF